MKNQFAEFENLMLLGYYSADETTYVYSPHETGIHRMSGIGLYGEAKSGIKILEG